MMSDSLAQAAKNRAEIAAIKQRYDRGEISRETAKVLAQPILDRINTRTAQIARKHGRQAYKLDFVNAMRNNY